MDMVYQVVYCLSTSLKLVFFQVVSLSHCFQELVDDAKYLQCITVVKFEVIDQGSPGSPDACKWGVQNCLMLTGWYESSCSTVTCI